MWIFYVPNKLLTRNRWPKTQLARWCPAINLCESCTGSGQVLTDYGVPNSTGKNGNEKCI